MTSYNDQLARHFARRVRGYLQQVGFLNTTAKSIAEMHLLNGTYVLASGIGSSITGYGADLLVVDDPIKNPREALSAAFRQHVWDWFMSVALTRLEPGGRVVVVMTRWHPDDLCGRVIQEMGEQCVVLRIPALAEEDDPLGRAPGEPLWAERFSKETLLQMRASMGLWFEGMYQQSPKPLQGGMFDVSKVQIVKVVPPVVQWVRAWDFAGTEASGAYTCGVLVGVTADQRYVVKDVVRQQVDAGKISGLVLATAMADVAENLKGYFVAMEQEPGSSGKLAVNLLAEQLAKAGVRARGFPALTAKVDRARALAQVVGEERLLIVQSDWNFAYLAELGEFPSSQYADQVDATTLAVMALQRKVVREAY